MELALRDNDTYIDNLEIKAEIAKRNPALNWLATLGQSSREMGFRMLAIIGRAVMPAIADKPSREVSEAMVAFDWSTIRYEHVEAILNKMQDEQYNPRTINLARWALRGISRHARKLKMITVEEYLNITEVKGKIGSRISKGKHIKPEEIAKLFNACDDSTKKGKRDGAILALLIGAGLRRDEVRWLGDSSKLAQLDPEDDAVTIIGKGNKERKIYLFPGSMERVQAWLDVRENSTDMPLFPAFTRSDKPIKRSISTQAVYDMMRVRCLQAGIRVYKPHDCRHTFITTMLENGADLSITQQQAGHNDIATTALYDRRGEKVRKAAAQKCKLPI